LDVNGEDATSNGTEKLIIANKQLLTFQWNNVPGAVVYLLVNATTGEELYEGPDFSFEKDLTGTGTNSYKVCAGDGEHFGEWSEAIAVTG